MNTEVKVADLPAVQEAFEKLRSHESCDQFYVLLQHESGNPNVIALESSGTGIDELCSKLDDCQVQYAIIKMLEVLDMSTTIKFVYIHWIGDKVPMVKKGRYGVVHGSVKDQLMSTHINVETSCRDDVTENNLTKLLNENSGIRSKMLEDNAAMALPRRGFTSTPTTQ